MIDSQIMRLMLEGMLAALVCSIVFCWIWAKLVDKFCQLLGFALDKLAKKIAKIYLKRKALKEK